MADTKIEPYRPIIPMIYAYTTPEIKRHQGWTKIGYTDKQTVKARINEQVELKHAFFTKKSKKVLQI